MTSLSDQLKLKGTNLRRVTTRVTLPSGQVYHEQEDGVRVAQESRACGFVIDTKPDLQVGRVERGLFVSSQDVANEPSLLSENGITHILNVAGFPSQKLPEITYLDISILDLPEEPLRSHFQTCFQFIDAALLQETGGVLVHCNAGVSRSVSVVLAYLMSRKRCSLDQALTTVRKVRPIAKPNDGFLQQLRLYENECIVNPSSS